jgi:hypothetical protein
MEKSCRSKTLTSTYQNILRHNPDHNTPVPCYKPMFLSMWAYIKNYVPIRKDGDNLIDSSQPGGVKPKMRERKLRSGVNSHGTLRQ